MPLESALFVQDLIETNPPGTDQKLQGDDHIRLIKAALKNTFPDATRGIRLKKVSPLINSVYNVDPTDENKLLRVDASLTLIDINLPVPSSVGDGWVIGVKKIDASGNIVRINGDIDGIVGGKSLSSANEAILLTTNGVSWFIVASHREAGQVAIKTGNYQLITSDNQSTFIAQTNDLDFVLPPVAQAPAGWRTFLKNNGTKKVRIVASGVELIDGVSQTPAISSFSVTEMLSTGTGWIIVSQGPEIGEVIMYGAVNPPKGYVACDEAAISRLDFSGLFSVVGTTYGVGDGSTTFNTPKSPGRGPIGQGAGTGLTTRALGDSGGEELHTMTESELVPHRHVIGSQNGASAGPGASEVASLTGALSGSTGGGVPFNVMDPFFVVKFCMKT